MTNTYTINGNSADTITIDTSSYTIDTSSFPSIGTITLNGAGASGTYLTSGSGTYTTTWASPPTNFGSSNGSPVMTIPHGEDRVVIEEQATLDVKGNVVINGIDLEQRLSTIEQVLNIPTRDVRMEAKYPKLKKLYEEYMHELEKYKTWDRVKNES